MVAKKLSGLRSLWLGALLSLLLSSDSFSGWDIRLENSSELVGGRYRWTVYVVAEEPVIDEIVQVVYFLHPSYRDPRRIVEMPGTNFPLTFFGREEFLIKADVRLRGGDVVPVEHWLRLEAHRTLIEERGLAVENTANPEKGDRWKWTIYIAAPDEVLDQIECVYYFLDPSYREPKRKNCDKESNIPGQRFFLTDTAWEPFEVGVRIEFIDGETKSLVHRLRTPHMPGEYELVALQSAQNEKYVRAGVGGESYLAAVSEHIEGWEIFEFIRLDENKVALQSIENRRYIRAGVGDESFLAAASGDKREWETFRLFQLEDDMVALQSIENNRFVRAGVGKDAYLAADSPDIGGWELFRLIYLEERAFPKKKR